MKIRREPFNIAQQAPVDGPRLLLVDLTIQMAQVVMRWLMVATSLSQLAMVSMRMVMETHAAVSKLVQTVFLGNHA